MKYRDLHGLVNYGLLLLPRKHDRDAIPIIHETPKRLFCRFGVLSSVAPIAVLDFLRAARFVLLLRSEGCAVERLPCLSQVHHHLSAGQEWRWLCRGRWDRTCLRSALQVLRQHQHCNPSLPA